jgi:hypothetical protein
MVPFIKDIAMVEDIYPRLETAKAADARAAQARETSKAPERAMTGSSR